MSYIPVGNLPSSKSWAVYSAIVNLTAVSATTTLSASYTQPAVGGSVTVTIASSTNLVVGSIVCVAGVSYGGVYRCTAKPSGTSATLQLLTAGATAPGGTVTTPASIGANVSPLVTLPTDRGYFVPTSFLIMAYDSLSVTGAGGSVYLGTGSANGSVWNEITSNTAPGGANFYSGDLNARLSANIAAGTVTQISLEPSRTLQIGQGTIGLDVNDRMFVTRGNTVYRVTSRVTTTLAANFTQPAQGASVAGVSLSSATGFAVNDNIYIESSGDLAGCYLITALSGTTATLSLLSTGQSQYAYTVGTGGTVSSGSTVVHASKINVTAPSDTPGGSTVGITSSNTSCPRYAPVGKVQRSTTLTASFSQPAAAGSVTVSVEDNRHFALTNLVYIGDYTNMSGESGTYTVTAKTGYKSLTLTLSTSGGASVGATIPSGTRLTCIPPTARTLSYAVQPTAVAPGATVAVYADVGIPYDVAKVFVRGFFTA